MTLTVCDPSSVKPSSAPQLLNTEEGFDRARAHIMGMSGKQIMTTAKKLFGDNKYQRIAFVLWMRTVQCRPNKKINPGMFPMNLVSEPGESKSAVIYEFGHIMEDWISELAGCPQEFHVVTLTISGGVNSLDELLGLVHVDHVAGKSKIFPWDHVPAGFHTKAWGFIFLDDFNRGEANLLAGCMELANRGRLNSYQLPLTMGVFGATNPSGTSKNHKVTRWDEAQYTRWTNLAYSPSRDLWYQALGKQGVPSEAIAYALKFKSSPAAAPSPSSSEVAKLLPEPRPVNKRNYTMFWHLYDALKHDDECLIEVAGSVLGLNEIKNLHAMLEGEIPLEPREIYGFTAREIKAGVGTVSAADAKDHALTTFERWKRDRRTDLVGVTLQWLANDLNDKDTNLADDQLDALFETLMALPAENTNLVLRKLVLSENCPRKDYWQPKIQGWKSPDGVRNGPLVMQLGADLMALKKTVAAEKAT